MQVNARLFRRRRRGRALIFHSGAEGDGGVGAQQKLAPPEERGPAAVARTLRLATAQAGNRRFWCLSDPRAHTEAPYKTDLHRKTLRALIRIRRPGQRRKLTGAVARVHLGVDVKVIMTSPCMFCIENICIYMYIYIYVYK